MTDSGWRKRQIALDVKAKNARELGLDYEVHSCSYYCDRPECIKAQRDELRDKLAQPKPVACTHEWIDATTTKPQWHCAKCGVEYKKEQA
jgi:hypothetical protein